MAIGEQMLARQVGQRPVPVRVAPGDQATQFGAVGAQGMRGAPGAVAQKERQRLGVVAGAQRVGDRIGLREASGTGQPG